MLLSASDCTSWHAIRLLGAVSAAKRYPVRLLAHATAAAIHGRLASLRPNPKGDPMTQSSYQAIHGKAPANVFPWVCSQLDCDEALPPGDAQRTCPRCGSEMIRGGRFLDYVGRDFGPTGNGDSE